MKDKELEDFAVGIREYALSLGVELYGVASAEAYRERFPDKPQPEQFVEKARSVIVIGLPFEPGTIATVLSPELAGLRAQASEQVGTSAARPAGSERFFLDEENGLITRELTMTGYKIAKYLRRHGWKSLHLPACKQNPRFRTAPFYHMPAMYLAGLGTLGLNCSIITPEFGPRVFVTSIVTDCPLPPGQPMNEELCTSCGLCAQNCQYKRSMEKEVRIPLPVPPTVAVLRASLSVRWVKYSLWQNQCMDPDVELATALRRLREADHAGVIRLICL